MAALFAPPGSWSTAPGQADAQPGAMPAVAEDAAEAEATNLHFFQLPLNALSSPGGVPSWKVPRDGLLGELVMRRSGKLEMRVGDSVYAVQPGTACSFDQEIVSFATPATAGSHMDLHRVGKLRSRLVVTPDANHLFRHFSARDLNGRADGL